jgi:hypothetical protein
VLDLALKGLVLVLLLVRHGIAHGVFGCEAAPCSVLEEGEEEKEEKEETEETEEEEEEGSCVSSTSPTPRESVHSGM